MAHANSIITTTVINNTIIGHRSMMALSSVGYCGVGGGRSLGIKKRYVISDY